MNRRNYVRLGALTMAAMMSFSGVTALAAPEGSYRCYKLAGVERTLTGDCGHEDGEEHENACYQNTYTINEEYKEAITNVIKEAGLSFDADEDGTLTDSEFINGVSHLDEKAVKSFQASVYEKIKNQEPDTVTNDKSTLDDSFWLIVENGPTFSLAVPTLPDSSEGSNEKVPMPTMTQKIVRTEADGTEKKVDVDDIGIGDQVTFEADVTVPKEAASVKGFAFTIHGKLDGLKLVEGPLLFVNGKEAALTGKHDAIEDGCAVHAKIVLDDLTVDGKKVDAKDGLTISMRYAAALDEKTLHTGANTAESWAEFEKDGVSVASTDVKADSKEDSKTDAKEDSKEESKEDSKEETTGSDTETVHEKSTVFTFGVTANSVDENNKDLAGADIKLYRQVGEDWKEVTFKNENAELNLTTFPFVGLDAGTYKLVEATVPANYTKVEDLIFEIRPEYDNTDGTASLKNLDVYIGGEKDTAAFTVDLEKATLYTTLQNAKGAHMPGTGANTRILMLTGGAFLILIGGCAFFGFKKKTKDAA